MSDEIRKSFEEYWNKYGELHASMCNGNIKQFAEDFYSAGAACGEKQVSRIKELEKKLNSFRNMLEDVVNELDLSESMIEEHGPWGTPPAELVRLVLERKDLKIRALKQGFNLIDTEALHKDGGEG